MEKALNDSHSLVNNMDTVKPNTELPADKNMKGYLYKRTNNLVKTWKRRWFYLQNNQLVYSKRSGEALRRRVVW